MPQVDEKITTKALSETILQKASIPNFRSTKLDQHVTSFSESPNQFLLNRQTDNLYNQASIYGV